ncbi:replication initiator [Lentzea sp. NPDC055074]
MGVRRKPALRRPQAARLGAHAAFRGHFLSKSQRYPVMFKRLREERREFRAAETLDRLGFDPEFVVVVNDWQYAASGYANPEERELALTSAEGRREQRQRTYARENAS